MLRDCRGIDRCDEAMLRSCFGPDARHGTFDGTSADFCTHALAIVAKVEFTHHQLGPVSIELAGDTGSPRPISPRCTGSAPPPPGGQPHEDRFSGGRYVDRFERRDGAWRIAERHGISEWMRYEPASDRGFYDGPADHRGRRDRSDPVYRR